ncbi:ABC transporter ATP-binding protein [Candidatus Bathyarchaeota archaeon]|nr:MAG: ABC transporter ATP-binding protein [Candidatus Bathyarchaeota archaeon]
MRERPIVEVVNVSYEYPGGIRAINNVSLTIMPGEFIALLGQNGSGKTTLAKLINGLLKPIEGKVLLKGKDTRKLTVAECAKIVGYVFQNPEHQIFASTIFEEIAFGPRNLGIPEDEVRRRVEESLRFVDLKKPMNAFPHLLSVGEKHRVAIASVLAMEPELLILDEPTTGIDFGRSLQIMRLLQRLRSGGRAVMVITHDLYLAAEFADRIIILKDGEKLADGPTKRIISDKELLIEAGLAPLQVTLLSESLQSYGIRPEIVRTMEFVDEFLKALERRRLRRAES